MSLQLVEPLPWDSAFLGFQVGRLVSHKMDAAYLTVLVAESKAAGIRLIYLVTDPADIEMANAAHQIGARLADRKVTFARPTTRAVVSAAFNHIESVTAYTPQLERLAWQSGAFSRFQRDENFAPHVFSGLYSRWLRASLSGKLARVVLASHSLTGAETGLLTLSERAGYASIGLLAVDGAVRGQGIGQQMVEAARQQALGWGCTQLQVVTQRDNVPACRFYVRCGFELVREEHLYHLWL